MLRNCVDYLSENILKKIPLAQTETEIELVLIPATKLGFNKAASRDLIYNRAKELGLDIVPAEVGPQLRLQYADQPMNKWIAIAMEPIADLRDHPNIFILSHPTDSRCLWLRVVYGHTSDMWNPYNYWVFTRRK